MLSFAISFFFAFFSSRSHSSLFPFAFAHSFHFHLDNILTYVITFLWIYYWSLALLARFLFFFNVIYFRPSLIIFFFDIGLFIDNYWRVDYFFSLIIVLIILEMFYWLYIFDSFEWISVMVYRDSLLRYSYCLVHVKFPIRNLYFVSPLFTKYFYRTISLLYFLLLDFFFLRLWNHSMYSINLILFWIDYKLVLIDWMTS